MPRRQSRARAFRSPSLAGMSLRAPTGSGKAYAYALPLQQLLRKHDEGAASAPSGVGAIVLVPTELCQQVHGVMRQLLGRAAGIKLVQLATSADASAISRHAPPDALIATPARLKQLILDDVKGAGKGTAPQLALRESVHFLVVDEADLLLSYGYGDDLAEIGSALPRLYRRCSCRQPSLPTSTRSVGFLHNPETIDYEDDGGAGTAGSGQLKQFWLRCSHDDKFLVMYALFKLNRIPGRSLIFVNSVDRGFRLRLFLEQFGVSAGVLNCELPLASRWHAIQAFNRGAFDILIATDDPKLMKGRASESNMGKDVHGENEPTDEPTGKGSRSVNAARTQPRVPTPSSGWPVVWTSRM